MKPKTTIFFFTILFCISCNDYTTTTIDYPILKASLTEKQISIHNIFEEINLIPLETTEEAFFRYPEKVEIYNDTVYLFDSYLYSLYIFGLDGKYINKIHRVGQGPEEYNMVYDFIINRYEPSIELLNPMGSIHKYKTDGTFIKKDDLPIPPTNYNVFELLDKNHYITWSRIYDDNGVHILTANDYQVSDSYFPNSGLWGAFTRNVFYKFDDILYYYESMTNKVYKNNSKGFETAYEWDLGVEIIKPQRLVASLEAVNETLVQLGKDFKERKIPFCFNMQYQTDKYYYASLRFGFEIQKSLFYDKSTKESILFERTTEGIKIKPVYVTNEYIIGILEYEDKNALLNVISQQDAELLSKMKEDENIWLIKFTFKK